MRHDEKIQFKTKPQYQVWLELIVDKIILNELVWALPHAHVKVVTWTLNIKTF